MFICMSAQIARLVYISDPGIKKSVVIPQMKKTKRARHCLFDEKGICLRAISIVSILRSFSLSVGDE